MILPTYEAYLYLYPGILLPQPLLNFSVLLSLSQIMKVTITSIELKGPFKFFALSYRAMNILRQLKATNCRAMKKKGIWIKHYTMTLWDSEQDLKEFATSGPHLDAMKASREIAKEIRTITYDADSLPDWKTAEALLEKGHIIRYESQASTNPIS